jgi:hypothetical protein
MQNGFVVAKELVMLRKERGQKLAFDALAGSSGLLHPRQSPRFSVFTAHHLLPSTSLVFRLKTSTPE